MITVAAVCLGRSGGAADFGGAYLSIALSDVLAAAPIMGVAGTATTRYVAAHWAGPVRRAGRTKRSDPPCVVGCCGGGAPLEGTHGLTTPGK